jgi:GTP-binding protein
MGRKQEKKQRAAGHRGACAIVAIVGRPNVGKSALFNRLTESRMAIVEDIAGVTRDRLYADASARGKDYVLVDTGGLDPYSDDPMRQSIAMNVRAALSEADVIICVLDGTEEPTLADREAVRLLRETQKPVIHVANKIDNTRASHAAMELYRLGEGSPYKHPSLSTTTGRVHGTTARRSIRGAVSGCSST